MAWLILIGIMLTLLATAALGGWCLSWVLAGGRPRPAGWIFIGLAVAGCGTALWLAAIPGRLTGLVDSVFWLAVGALPVLAVLGLVGLVAVACVRRKLADAWRAGFGPWKSVTVGVLLFGTWAAVQGSVPARVGFATSREAFDARVETAPVHSWGGEDPGGRIGLYEVDAYARDARGGVYFRTGTSLNMIDQFSYGFAFRPNEDGSPFGNADYDTWPLGDDWFVFRASDDY